MAKLPFGPSIIPTPTSSNVHGFYWLPRRQAASDQPELHVFFKSKLREGQYASHYVYINVSENIYDEFFSATSKGKFVHQILSKLCKYQRLS